MIFIAAKISDLIYTWAVWVLIPILVHRSRCPPRALARFMGRKCCPAIFEFLGIAFLGRTQNGRGTPHLSVVRGEKHMAWMCRNHFG
jgi:hypothetical protein